jgi:hypothetical protein
MMSIAQWHFHVRWRRRMRSDRSWFAVSRKALLEGLPEKFSVAHSHDRV